jgi:hypothetical protein
LVLDHFRIDDEPTTMAAGAAVKLTVGLPMTLTVADAFAVPPSPVHARE